MIVSPKNLLLVLGLVLTLGVLGALVAQVAQHAGGRGTREAGDLPSSRFSSTAETADGKGSSSLQVVEAGSSSSSASDDDALVTTSAAADQAELMLGEPGYVTFKVVNRSDRAWRFMVGGDYCNELGRPNSFKVEVVSTERGRVAQPEVRFEGGGMCWMQKLAVNGQHTFRLFLPHWATFEKPGKYTVTIHRKFSFVPEAAIDPEDPFRPSADTITMTLTATATVTIVPADKEKMGKIIDKLGDTMLSKNADESEESQKMLAAIHDERVIP